MEKIKNLAFSLIELMIALITIATITAAFSPVIMKNIKISNLVASGGGQFTMNCATKVNSDCKLCRGEKCYLCDKKCESTQYLDTYNCECKECYAAGLINCVSCKFSMKSETAKCTKCTPGYYLHDGVCEKCPAGHKCPNGGDNYIACDPNKGEYQDEEGQTVCKDCTGDDKHCSQCTSNSVGTCKNCKKGYKLSGTSCEACAIGTYQNQDNYAGNSCTGCSAGTYNSNTAETQCYVCEAGYKCPGSSNRIECAAGYYSAAGQSECSDCNNGYRCPNKLTTLNGRTPCEIGHYTPDSGRYTTSCTPCASGNYNSNTAEHQCYECPAGHYCSGGSDKIPCQGGTVEGHYQSLTGQSSCLPYSITGCTSYPNGATAQVCEACRAGYYINGSTCTSCSVFGTQCSTCTSSVCTNCGSDATPNSQGVCEANCSVEHCATCVSGNANACETCETGYYKKNSICESCASGYYFVSNGSCPNTTCSNSYGTGSYSGCNNACSGFACTSCCRGYTKVYGRVPGITSGNGQGYYCISNDSGGAGGGCVQGSGGDSCPESLNCNGWPHTHCKRCGGIISCDECCSGYTLKQYSTYLDSYGSNVDYTICVVDSPSGSSSRCSSASDCPTTAPCCNSSKSCITKAACYQTYSDCDSGRCR